MIVDVGCLSGDIPHHGGRYTRIPQSPLSHELERRSISFDMLGASRLLAVLFDHVIFDERHPDPAQKMLHRFCIAVDAAKFTDPRRGHIQRRDREVSSHRQFRAQSALTAAQTPAVTDIGTGGGVRQGVDFL